MSLIALLAEGNPLAGWSFVQIIIAIIVIAGAVAILFLVFRKLGITIPDFVVQIFWIVVLIVIAVVAIKFIASLW